MPNQQQQQQQQQDLRSRPLGPLLVNPNFRDRNFCGYPDVGPYGLLVPCWPFGSVTSQPPAPIHGVALCAFCGSRFSLQDQNIGYYTPICVICRTPRGLQTAQHSQFRVEQLQQLATPSVAAPTTAPASPSTEALQEIEQLEQQRARTDLVNNSDIHAQAWDTQRNDYPETEEERVETIRRGLSALGSLVGDREECRELAAEHDAATKQMQAAKEKFRAKQQEVDNLRKQLDSKRRANQEASQGTFLGDIDDLMQEMDESDLIKKLTAPMPQHVPNARDIMMDELGVSDHIRARVAEKLRKAEERAMAKLQARRAPPPIDRFSLSPSSQNSTPEIFDPADLIRSPE